MRKQWRILGRIFLLFAPPSFATSYYVTPNGNDCTPFGNVGFSTSSQNNKQKTSRFQGIVVY